MPWHSHRLAVLAPILLLLILSTGCEPAERSMTIAWNGTRFELTGDSIASGPEVARKTTMQLPGLKVEFVLTDGRLAAFNGTQQIWVAEEDITVDSFLVGDPDNDGAEEVIFSLWKADETGRPGSEFWIYGYSDGKIRAEWCGSAVADPIRHFAVADADFDGNQELVVLEGSYEESKESAAHSVTIWRWNGWGFTNLWRSNPGTYTSLATFDSTTSGSPFIQVRSTN